ncbi:MAG: SH3 domain-containing protein [bacterium]|nr:SH3 domain-containing protein [bacterium]
MRQLLYTSAICVIIIALVGCGGKDDADGEDGDITEIGDEASEEETEKTGVITVPALNIRDEASTSGKVIGKVSLGDRVTILEEGSTETIGGDTGTWYKVSAPNGDQGWVFGAYVKLDSGGGTTAGGDVLFDAPDRADEVPVEYTEPFEEGLSAKDYHSKGKSAEGTGDKSDALSYYGKAAEMESDNFQFHFDLAMLLQDMGRNKEAASEYEECVRVKPDNFWSYNNLGLACINSNQPERAVVVLEKAIKLEPKGSMDKDKALGIARRNLAAAYRMTGQADKAAGLN